MSLIRKHCGNHFRGESYGARIIEIAAARARSTPDLGAGQELAPNEHFDAYTEFNIA
jgi:hypothetical protein